MTTSAFQRVCDAYAQLRFKWNDLPSTVYDVVQNCFDDAQREMLTPFSSLLTYPYFSFAIGPGWWAPVQQALSALTALQDRHKDYTIEVVQVKEKFGGLRLYVQCYRRGVDPFADDEDNDPALIALRTEIGTIVRTAEVACSTLCEVCGEPGIRVQTGWVKTLCEQHASMKIAFDKTRG